MASHANQPRFIRLWPFDLVVAVDAIFSVQKKCMGSLELQKLDEDVETEVLGFEPVSVARVEQQKLEEGAKADVVPYAPAQVSFQVTKLVVGRPGMYKTYIFVGKPGEEVFHRLIRDLPHL